MGLVAKVILFGWAATAALLTYWRPSVLGCNAFLNSFADDQSLNIIGVIAAIFLPTSASLYVRLAELEQKYRIKTGDLRKKIRKNCAEVIAFFVAIIVILSLKSHFPEMLVLSSIANGATLWVILANLLVLADVTESMFKIGDFGEPGSANRRDGNDEP